LGDFLVDVGSTNFGVEDFRAAHERQIFILANFSELAKQKAERERHAKVAGAERTREDEKWRMDQRRVAVARDAPEERPASGRWIGLVVCRRRRLHSWLYHNLNPLQRQEFALETILTVITINSTTTTVRRRARAEHEAA
jgi:hypothetical protein